MSMQNLSPEEIARWLERRVSPAVWQHSGVSREIARLEREALQRAVHARQIGEARQALQEFLRWAHVRKALTGFLTSGERRAWRLQSSEALAEIWAKWPHWSPEERAHRLQALLADEAAWKVDEGPICPSEKEVLSLVSALVSVAARAKRKSGRGAMAVGIVALVLGLLLGGGVVFAWQRTSTASPSTSATLVITPTPAIVAAPTVMLPTVAPTPLPTPTPSSAYDVAPLAWIAPAFPQDVEPMFVIDDTRATLIPAKGWKKGDTGLGGHHVYWDTPVVVGKKVTATWAMDVPWPQDGLFQLLALDPASQGGGVDLTYQVLVNGAPVAPLAGKGTIHQRSTFEGQRTDEWQTVGIYRLPRGAQIAVRLDLAGFKGLPQRRVAGVDAIAWAAVVVPTVQNYAPMQQAPGTVVYWVDNPQARLSPKGGWQVIPPSPENFGGAVRFQATVMGKGYAEWVFPKVLPGYYQLCAWIPPTQATMRWRVNAGKAAKWAFDNKNLPDPIKADTVEFAGKDYKHWVCLGWLTVQKTDTVSVRLSGKGNLIADAVFLLAAHLAPTPTPSPTVTSTVAKPYTPTPTATPAVTPTPTPAQPSTPTVTPAPTSAPTPTSTPSA